MNEKLTVNINLVGKEPCHEPDKCVVEKAIPIPHSEFKKINSKLLEPNYYISKYKELMLEADGINHCILLYDKSSGDGLLVNSEGCGYARYSQYIPHAKDIVEAHGHTAALSELKSEIDKNISEWLENNRTCGNLSVKPKELFNTPEMGYILAKYVFESLQNRPEILSCTKENGSVRAEMRTLSETRLYCPLKITVDDHDDSADLYESPSCCYTEYEDKINEKIRQSFDYDENERGLVTWCDDKDITQKVFSAKPFVEVRDGDLYGCVLLKHFGDLDKADLVSVSDYISGQLSDGWGEGFEQHEISAGDEDIYVSFWNIGDEYFLKPESEAFPEPNYEMKFGG
ncbi:MAG: hypothetical protein K2N26_03120 [Oscillospiraceae bacterium]|nr:hypothetical protein [Oscillospiraceae bacterium]